MRIFLPVEREVYDMMERNHWFNEQNNAKHRYWLNLFINGTYPMGLSETGTNGDKPSSLGVPHLQTDLQTKGVSHQGHPVIIQLNSWYLCMEFKGEKGVPQNFWETFKFEIEPSKNGFV